MNALINIASFAQEHGEDIHETVGTGGWAAENAWIMLVLPFVAALAILALGKRDEKWGSRIAIGMMSYVFLHGAWLWFLTITEGVVY